MPSSTTLPVASYEAFRSLTPSAQAKLVERIAKDREGNLSGNDLRERYGSWLSGPRRCKLLREFGHGSVVAKSYDDYRDDAKTAPLVGGAQRIGSRHAKLHGPGKAAQSRRAALVADAEAAKLAKAAKRIAAREAKAAAKA